ncbi:MAG: response regulator transcription factor [Deltaproteobacteria bacterium]|nr:response regulator transcription factor [Deltaproteobacteria bacterium]
MIRILIADDHAIVRQGLKQIVSETGDMIVAGEAADGRELLALMKGQACDVVLLDIAMPGRGGLETLKQLKRERPDLPVLILSVYPEEQYAVRALKAGAAGYLNKESAPEELVAAIRIAARGKKYVSPAVAETLASRLDEDSPGPPHKTLSDREYQVMAMLASGRTVSEIAGELSLSVKTISTNRTRLLKKMGMRTNAELTYYAIKEGLVG